MLCDLSLEAQMEGIGRPDHEPRLGDVLSEALAEISGKHEGGGRDERGDGYV